MKKVFRMIIFSALAIIITSLWNKGFIIEYNWLIIGKATLLIALVNYLVVPVSKLILLPLNLLTLGLVSVVFYSLVLFFLLNKFSLIEIKAWNFPGFIIYGYNLAPVAVSQLINIFLSAFSISFITKTFEKIL